MIHFGMPPNPALSAGMVLTDLDRKKLESGKLRKGCRHQGAKFVAEYRVKGHDTYLGTFDTIEECNAAWDAEKARRHALKGIRKPAAQGYTTRLKGGRVTYVATVCYKGKTKFVGTFYNEADARARHAEGIDALNNGTFEEWNKNRPRGVK